MHLKDLSLKLWRPLLNLLSVSLISLGFSSFLLKQTFDLLNKIFCESFFQNLFPSLFKI